MSVQIKRIYEDADSSDGIRVLVDRVWPRGISKEKAKLDYWLKDAAPSTELRKWFGHDPEKYETFKEKYQTELENGKQKDTFAELQQIISETTQNVTLLYAAKDKEHNQAQVLIRMLNQK